jgi:tetratricopeptide (TPR) repeat protein
VDVADIFISYTSDDREWAFWIGHELEALGHVPHIHEWEISGGGDIMAWMEDRHQAADHILCVISPTYLSKPYSSLERRAAQWAATTDRPSFALPVFVERCEAKTLFSQVKRCDLYGVSEEEARERLLNFLEPARKPAQRATFPGRGYSHGPLSAQGAQQFPGTRSNIPISIPLHFMGREDALAAIESALKRYEGRVAITALHGLRGVGKTTLAAAYAERHRSHYRATRWIRAQVEQTLRADLVALGIRLAWVGSDDKEERAVETMMERLRHEGEGILLIFDNAIDPDALKPYLPRGGVARVLVTSNAHAWRGLAAPVEIRLWPKQIGADYLIARTGREAERSAAETLSQALGGLPLAHEQAAAYCERLDVSLADYSKRFETAPVRLLDDARHAPTEYHDGLTVAKTFALAIEEAAKIHPAAEPLIVNAALLAPDPIPLFLFKEARERFGEPLASMLNEDGLGEAVAALRAFALVEREAIVYERDASITTEAIRLHRLVREVAASRREGESRNELRRALIAALGAVYPADGWDNPSSWLHCAPLTPHLLSICLTKAAKVPAIAECADLLNRAGHYFCGRAAYSGALPLFEDALAICETVLGPEHLQTAFSLNNLSLVCRSRGDLRGARPLAERALAIQEKVHGPEHPDTAWSLSNLARLLHGEGDLAGAKRLAERALAIREKIPGPEHPDTAWILTIDARVAQDQGDLARARSIFERALAIREKTLGPEHPYTGYSLGHLASVLGDQGDLVGARPLLERALAIHEKVLGPEHSDTAWSLINLAVPLQAVGDLATARPLLERALAIYERTLGPESPVTATSLSNVATLLSKGGYTEEAEPLFKRAVAIGEKVVGLGHPLTQRYHSLYARLFLDTGRAAQALSVAQAALATHEATLDPNHSWTKDSARVTADALDAQDRTDEAAELRARYGIDGP